MSSDMMNDKEIEEKWKEILATAANDDPRFSFNLFKGLLEKAHQSGINEGERATLNAYESGTPQRNDNLLKLAASGEQDAEILKLKNELESLKAKKRFCEKCGVEMKEVFLSEEREHMRGSGFGWKK